MIQFEEKFFRVWDSERKMMWEGWEIKEIWNDGFNMGVGGNCDLTNSSKYNIDDLIWMQDIGLKDRNNKKIYEGDIMYLATEKDYNWSHIPLKGYTINIKESTQIEDYKLEKDEKYVVGYNPRHCDITPEFQPYIPKDNFVCELHYDFTQSEIIGNVFQNPELLDINN